MKSKERMRPARAKAYEKRGTIRIAIQLKVDVESPNNHYLFEVASNISESGIFIQTEAPLDPGTHLNLQFDLAEREQIRARGEVIWVNDGDEDDPGMGVKFLSLSAEDRHRILAAIKKLAIL